MHPQIINKSQKQAQKWITNSAETVIIAYKLLNTGKVYIIKTKYLVLQPTFLENCLNDVITSKQIQHFRKHKKALILKNDKQPALRNAVLAVSI